MSFLYVLTHANEQRHYRSVSSLASALAGGYMMDETILEVYSDTVGELETINVEAFKEVALAHSKQWSFREPPIMSYTGPTPEQKEWRKRHDAARKAYLKTLVAKLESCFRL